MRILSLVAGGVRLRRMHLLWALPLLVASVYAQTSTGALRGFVQDLSGARIVAATVEITSSDGSFRRVVSSDKRGEFQVQNLSGTLYKVHVEDRGFTAITSEITVAISTTRELTVTLKPLTVAQTAGVRTGSSSISEQPIDLSSNVQQSVVSRQDLEQIPLPARSFADIAYLAAGTEPVEPSDPTKARITAVSTGGSSGLNNELSVDGGDNSDDYIGGFLQNFSPDAIREFAIRTAQEDADTGGTTAGSLVITTRSGSNALHGDAAVYERTAALNARYPIENPAPDPKQPFSRQNYVATLGGPILKSKLLFFGALEAVHEDASIAYSPASVAQFNALATLASEGLIAGVTSIPVNHHVDIPFRDYLGSLRFDWAQSAKSQWYLRGSVDNYTTHNSLVQQGTLPSTGLLTHNNYLSMVLGNEYAFKPNLLGQFVFNGGGLHLTQSRNSTLGFALAFPFSSTAATISGFETFGDNQFATPITFFPSMRSQEKYQLRYDLSYAPTRHSIKTGVNFIHEPVLGGAFPGNAETLYQFPLNPTDYLGNEAQFTADKTVGASNRTLGGSFSQNIQRLAVYAQDAWRISPRFTLNYGLRYSTTYGLFLGSGQTQLANPGYRTLQALGIPLVTGVPHDDRKQFAPRLGFAYSPGGSGSTVVRGGFGLYYNDLAQSGWATAFQNLNPAPGGCVDPVTSSNGQPSVGCVPGDAAGGTVNLIDPHYKTPYAIHTSVGIEHAFSPKWLLSADYIHEQGNHAYRAYSYTGGTNLFTPQLAPDDPTQATYVPDANVFHSDNRSSYNALLVHLHGSLPGRFTLVANYTLAHAQTWGCVLGETFDYVNGVCDPLQPFAPGDYGPSGEDVRHRGVIAGTLRLPGGVELSGLAQAESARPYTITTADGRGRIATNGVETALDAFRGTPYVQLDMRVSRPTVIRDRWTVMPFAEFFNLLNRSNPGANYVTNVASLPVPAAETEAGNVTDVCRDAACDATQPLSGLKQLRLAGGALGDFFGPGTTVGIPFAAQLGVRVSF